MILIGYASCCISSEYELLAGSRSRRAARQNNTGGLAEKILMLGRMNAHLYEIFQEPAMEDTPSDVMVFVAKRAHTGTMIIFQSPPHTAYNLQI